MTATVSAHMLRCLNRERRSYCGGRCCGRPCSFALPMSLPRRWQIGRVRSAALSATIREHVWSLALRVARKRATRSIKDVYVDVHDIANDMGPMTWPHDMAGL